MVLRVVRRVFRAVAGLAVVSVASLAIASGLAVWPPGFYADWRSRTPSPEQVEAAATRVKSEREAYVRWRAHAEAAGAEQLEALPHEVSFTDADLNTLLVAEASDSLKAPCFRVSEGRVAVAAALPPDLGSLVLSCELAPRLTPEGVAVLDIRSASVGRLPVPIGIVASFLPRGRHRVSGNLHLDLAEARPRLALDLGDAARSLRADSLRCLDGRVVVRFAAAKPAG